MMGGPIGALMGFALGSVFDAGDATPSTKRKITQPGDFVVSLVLLSAAVMKADGRLLKSELKYIRNFFTAQFGAAHVGEIMKILQLMLKRDIPVEEVCGQITQYMQYAERLQLLHYLFGIAQADGEVSESEAALIRKIGRLLGIRANDFSSIGAMFSADNGSAYKILEIKKDADNKEVKAAYRKMARKYHPDKVSHLGEDVKKAATAKFQEVQQAYEKIKKERGIK